MTGPAISRIDSLKALAQKEPGNGLIRYMLANEHLKAKEYASALEELGFYFGIADDEGSGYRMAAIAHLALGQEEEAKGAYRTGIEAAGRHHHPGMASEFEAALEEIP